jgi:protein SCO1/2
MAADRAADSHFGGSGAVSSRAGPGGDFMLTDHSGRQFRLSDQRGKVILLFFGYTSCTEACPIILGRLNSVFKHLGSDRDKTLAVFISVDPQRDTTHVLRDYVLYFSAHTVALTSKKEEIDAVVKRYGRDMRSSNRIRRLAITSAIRPTFI